MDDHPDGRKIPIIAVTANAFAEDVQASLDAGMNGHLSKPIVMDIEMPEMDGYEATLRIRKLPNRIRANIPIIAFTSNAVSENRDRAFAVGMDGFLVKPINTSRLLSCLAKFL